MKQRRVVGGGGDEGGAWARMPADGREIEAEPNRKAKAEARQEEVSSRSGRAGQAGDEGGVVGEVVGMRCGPVKRRKRARAKATEPLGPRSTAGKGDRREDVRRAEGTTDDGHCCREGRGWSREEDDREGRAERGRSRLDEGDADKTRPKTTKHSEWSVSTSSSRQ